MSYVGMGRISGSESLNPISKPLIFVINQEFYKQLKNKLKFSLALSFRNQKEEIPSKNKIVNQQELRFYGRISRSFNAGKLKITPTFRQEIRKFFVPDGLEDDESFSFRSRFRVQLSFNLNSDESKKIILSDEQLFSVDKDDVTKNWTDFKYNESRFMLYYSVSPKKSPVIINIGYMNNLVGGSHPYDASYVAFDIILKNPIQKI